MTTIPVDQKPHFAIPAGYRLYSLRLLVERRTCECCNRSYDSPSPHLRVKVVNSRGASQSITLSEMGRAYKELHNLIEAEAKVPVLPHEIEIVELDVPFCQGCFTEFTADQQDMFDPKLPKNRTEIARSIGIAESLLEEHEEMSRVRMSDIEKEKLARAVRGSKKKTVSTGVVFDLKSLLSSDNPNKYR